MTNYQRHCCFPPRIRKEASWGYFYSWERNDKDNSDLGIYKNCSVVNIHKLQIIWKLVIKVETETVQE